MSIEPFPGVFVYTLSLTIISFLLLFSNFLEWSLVCRIVATERVPSLESSKMHNYHYCCTLSRPQRPSEARGADCARGNVFILRGYKTKQKSKTEVDTSGFH